MTFFRKLFARSTSRRGSRFQRYYGNVLGTGAGYPTADEARRDMAQNDRNNHPYGWPV